MKRIIWSLIVDSALSLTSLWINFSLDQTESLKQTSPQNFTTPSESGSLSFLGASALKSLDNVVQYFSSVLPVIGEIRDSYELFTGEDFLSGERLRLFDVVFNLISIIFNFYLHIWSQRQRFFAELKASWLELAGDT